MKYMNISTVKFGQKIDLFQWIGKFVAIKPVWQVFSVSNISALILKQLEQKLVLEWQDDVGYNKTLYRVLT